MLFQSEPGTPSGNQTPFSKTSHSFTSADSFVSAQGEVISCILTECGSSVGQRFELTSNFDGEKMKCVEQLISVRFFAPHDPSTQSAKMMNDCRSQRKTRIFSDDFLWAGSRFAGLYRPADRRQSALVVPRSAETAGRARHPVQDAAHRTDELRVGHWIFVQTSLRPPVLPSVVPQRRGAELVCQRRPQPLAVFKSPILSLNEKNFPSGSSQPPPTPLHSKVMHSGSPIFAIIDPWFIDSHPRVSFSCYMPEKWILPGNFFQCFYDRLWLLLYIYPFSVIPAFLSTFSLYVSLLVSQNWPRRARNPSTLDGSRTRLMIQIS